MAIAIDTVTNKIYVTNYGSSNVTIIDGTTNSTTTVSVGTYPWGTAVNAVINKIYMANKGNYPWKTNRTVTVVERRGHHVHTKQ